jgi:pyridoxal phosphate-dependent aminotransferase EpsN
MYWRVSEEDSWKYWTTRFHRDSLSKYNIEMMPVSTEGEPNYWLSVVGLQQGDIVPSELISFLNNHNIESRPVWKPMHLQPVFSDCKFITAKSEEPVGLKLYEQGVCLPSGSDLTQEDQTKIIDVIGLFYSKVDV